MNPVAQLVKAAGGPEAFARAVTRTHRFAVVSRDDVYNWRRRGRIPGQYLLAVDEVATDLRLHELMPQIERAAVRANRQPEPVA
jgi:hypothetical protein